MLRELRTPLLPEAHVPVGYRWQNSRCCQPCPQPQHSYISDLVSHPNDSADLQELELRIRLCEELSNREPKPFDWKFTKYDLFDLLQRLAKREAAFPAATPASLPC